MGFNLDIKGGIDETVARLKAPFTRFMNAEQRKEELRAAHARNDFTAGFEMLEYEDGKALNAEKVILLGDSMPHQPFTFGGQQKIVKEYYPGNSEPTVQVLGARENNIVIRGRLKAKHFRDNVDSFAVNAKADQTLREYPQEQQQLIEAMRIRGNLVRITMGEFQRFGFIEEATFNMKTIADIEYEITFLIIGFNPPSDCKYLSGKRTIPFDINKELIRAALELQANFGAVPDSVPRTLAEQFNDLIGEVAGAISLVTGFVDNVLNEVDSLKASLARAKGLILNAQAKLSEFRRRVGDYPPTGGVSQVGGISAAYTNAKFFKDSISATFSLTAFLASLRAQLALIAETEPLARHRVIAGDTLQKIAVKFYNDAGQWKEIYDHNKLQDTNLSIGTVLEIPRVT